MNPTDPNTQQPNPVSQDGGQSVQPSQVAQPIPQPMQPSVQPPLPAQPVIPVPQPVQVPVQPVSTPLGKENAGVSIPKPQEQWIQETAPVAEIAPDIKEAGVEAVKGEVVEMAPSAVAAGVQPVGLATPVPTEPAVEFPMTEEKAKGILKMHKKVKDSIYWLAMLILRQIKLLRFKQEHKTEEVTA